MLNDRRKIMTWLLIPTIFNTNFLLEGTKSTINTNFLDDSIEEVVEENDSLTEIEKDIIKSMNTMIEENPNLDRKKVYKTLKTVHIIKIEDDKEQLPQTVGMYVYSKNQIRIIEDNDTHNTLIHELIHCIYTNQKNQELPTYFTEGVTELLANEYFSNNPYIEEKNYPFEVTMVKILCEMIGPEKVLETYTTGDGNIIFNALTKVMSKKETEVFLKNINQMFQLYQSGKKCNTSVNNQVLTYLDHYYQKTKNEDITDDIYLYNRGIIELLSQERPNVNYRMYILEHDYYKKAYFSKKLIQQTKNIVWENSDEKAKEKVI